jgi:hypothetical protein
MADLMCPSRKGSLISGWTLVNGCAPKSATPQQAAGQLIGNNHDVIMAEREGFEPSVPLLAAHAISSRAPSASSDISPDEFSLVWFFFDLQEKNEAFSGTGIIQIFYTLIFKKVKCLFSVSAAPAVSLYCTLG